MQTDLRLLFEKAQTIIDLANEQKRQANLRGENYNIFEILHLKSNETRLHSAIIADLLNPKGNHALGIKPLQNFIESLNIDRTFSTQQLKDAEIKVEYCLGCISDDRTQGGNIDILVRIDDFLLVIENKIYAIDQPTQLLRYHNFCKEKSHKLLYLTLDGHPASLGSSGSLEPEKDYYCISYQQNILLWIEKCISYAIFKPLVRETLQQYYNIIQQLTSQNMDTDSRLKLFELMTNYPDVVKSVIDNQFNYKTFLIENYIIAPFKKWCKESGFEWYEDPNFINQAKYSSFGIHRREWNKMIAVEFVPDALPSYGVYRWKSTDSTQKDMFGFGTNESWPFGWRYFDKYQNWDIISLSKELAEGNIFNFIRQEFIKIDEILKQNPEKYPMI
ncbi:MAG: PD-(D/E)XK nuclease family protein [Coprobacter sp.]|nr:PD-(D/E)XK nuclease family protein [Coprobacter sp.]